MQRKKQKRINMQDYRLSEYIIDHTELHFDLDEDRTIVKSKLDIRKNPKAKSSTNTIVLDGERLELDSIFLNGKELNASQYKVTKSSLQIEGVPKHFTLQIQNHLSPNANISLEGLYITKGI